MILEAEAVRPERSGTKWSEMVSELPINKNWHLKNIKWDLNNSTLVLIYQNMMIFPNKKSGNQILPCKKNHKASSIEYLLMHPEEIFRL